MDRLISIGAEVTDEFECDELCVEVSLKGEDATSEGCTKAYNAKLGRVRDALVKAGVARELIKNSSFQVRPNVENLYEHERGVRYYVRKVLFKGCEYEGEVSVKVPRDLNLGVPIWSALDGLDDVLFSLRYQLADESAARATLLAEAVEQARSNAEALATASGVRLGPVASISYQYESGRRSYVCCEECASSDDRSSAPEFNPEPVSIDCSLKMQWAIE